MTIFEISSNANRNTHIGSHRSILESKFFFYKKLFSKRKNLMKVTGRTTMYVYDNVRNDYFINMRYGRKTFFNMQSGIIKSMIKDTKKFALISTSLYQKKYKDLAIFQKNLLFHSNQDFRFRNFVFKIKPLKSQFSLFNSALITKTLNKMIYFKLFLLNKNISFSSNGFLFNRNFWKKNFILFFHLGFIFKLKNKFKNKKNLFFNLNNIKYNRKIKRKLLRRKSKLIKKRRNGKLITIKRKIIRRKYIGRFFKLKRKDIRRIFRFKKKPKRINGSFKYKKKWRKKYKYNYRRFLAIRKKRKTYVKNVLHKLSHKIVPKFKSKKYKLKKFLQNKKIKKKIIKKKRREKKCFTKKDLFFFEKRDKKKRKIFGSFKYKKTRRKNKILLVFKKKNKFILQRKRIKKRRVLALKLLVKEKDFINKNIYNTIY